MQHASSKVLSLTLGAWHVGERNCLNSLQYIQQNTIFVRDTTQHSSLSCLQLTECVLHSGRSGLLSTWAVCDHIESEFMLNTKIFLLQFSCYKYRSGQTMKNSEISYTCLQQCHSRSSRLQAAWKSTKELAPFEVTMNIKQ